jgi:hypothetical protein
MPCLGKPWYLYVNCHYERLKKGKSPDNQFRARMLAKVTIILDLWNKHQYWSIGITTITHVGGCAPT